MFGIKRESEEKFVDGCVERWAKSFASNAIFSCSNFLSSFQKMGKCGKRIMTK